MNIPYMRYLNAESVEFMVQNLKHQYYEEGQIIIKEEQILNTIYILDEG